MRRTRSLCVIVILVINRLNWHDTKRTKHEMAASVSQLETEVPGSVHTEVDDGAGQVVVKKSIRARRLMRKMSQRTLSFFQIFQSATKNGDGDEGDTVGGRRRRPRVESSSVFYVSNDDDDDDVDEDNDDDDNNDTFLQLDFPNNQAGSPPAYENIGGTSTSGSELGGTLEGKKRRQKTNNGGGTGRNKFGFGSVGNLGERTKPGEGDDDDGDGDSHVPSKRNSKGSGSEQNLNDPETPDGLEELIGTSRRRNESENENGVGVGGPQSLFIRRKGSGGPSHQHQQNPPPPPDRKFIGGAGSSSSTSSKKGKESSSVISGQQPEINGCGNNRASYTSSTSRTSTTSSELSFSEIFARNMKRTFKSNKTSNKQVCTMSQMRSECLCVR